MGKSYVRVATTQKLKESYQAISAKDEQSIRELCLYTDALVDAMELYQSLSIDGIKHVARVVVGRYGVDKVSDAIGTASATIRGWTKESHASLPNFGKFTKLLVLFNALDESDRCLINRKE